MPLWSWLALAALVVAPAFFWRGGVVEEETIVFLEHYLDGRTALQKIFDPHGNDFDTYQARELSYFFDFLDAQWLRALLRAGVVLFIPPSAVVASILTAWVFARGAGRVFPGLPASTRSLVLLVLLSNYVFLTTMGLFYRATKPMLVPVLLGLAFFLWARLVPRGPVSEAPGRDFAIVVAGGCLMSALDRQGFFYLLVACAGLGLLWLLRRTGGMLCLGAAVAALASEGYNRLLGPWLIHAINGYRPRFNYQRVPIRKLADPAYYLKAAELLPEYAATLFGGFSAWLLALAAVGAVVFWIRRRRHQAAPASWTARWLGPSLLALFLASQVFMFAAMIMRYPQVYDWADHRLWYYPWPFQALLAFGLLAALDSTRPRTGPRGRRLVDLALVLVVVANVGQWPRHREISLHSDWFPKIHDQTKGLEASLRAGAADPGLYGAYREFLHFVWDLSPVLAARITAEVREGAGFYRTEVRDGRVFAWARKGATLELLAQEAGDHRLVGQLWLRSGETVSVGRSGAVVARVGREEKGEGPAPFSLSVLLSPGRTELTFESDRDERDVGGLRDQKAASFGLFLPVLQDARATP